MADERVPPVAAEVVPPRFSPWRVPLEIPALGFGETTLQSSTPSVLPLERENSDWEKTIVLVEARSCCVADYPAMIRPPLAQAI
jgi:hypothetical protein